MESKTDISIQFINKIVNTSEETGKLDINFEQIKDIIYNKFEDITGCKLYNKDNIIQEIDNNNLVSSSISEIKKNLIPQITFNSMFKSNLDFYLVFSQDNVVVIYKNEKVVPSNIENIKLDLINTKHMYLPVISNFYVDNIFSVINKLVNKDLTVRYNLIDVPKPYWNLFCCKSKNTTEQNNKYYEDIISGKNYIKNKQETVNSYNEDLCINDLLNILSEDESNKFLIFYSKLNDLYINTEDDIFDYVNFFFELLELSLEINPNLSNYLFIYYKLLNFVILNKETILNSECTHPNMPIEKRIERRYDNEDIILHKMNKAHGDMINVFDNCSDLSDDNQKIVKLINDFEQNKAD